MARHHRSGSTTSNVLSQHDEHNSNNDDDALDDLRMANGQEMGSMYDYLAKIILLGPSGSGKSCLLHRFTNNSWRTLTSQTIGVEFASKIVKVGHPSASGRRKRIKLQLWDTAGTERFRSVSRSYYRGAAGAVLCYDISDPMALRDRTLVEFLNDARALASPKLAVVLAGNKLDLAADNQTALRRQQQQQQQSLLDDADNKDQADDNDITTNHTFDFTPTSFSAHSTTASSLGSIGPTLGSQMRATTSSTGRAIPTSTATDWAASHSIPSAMEVSALSGEGVDEIFHKLARTILTKIELGEIDPDDNLSGVQYGDADYYSYLRDDDAGSLSGKSDGAGLFSGFGVGAGSTRRRRKNGNRGRDAGGGIRGGVGEWGEVFRLGTSSRRRGCC